MLGEDERYLRLGGWMTNDRGWWHPPSCLASWPIEEAVRMARDDEARGLRMNDAELRRYLKSVGVQSVEEYLAMLV